jgi:hypothetical protein
MASLSFSQGSSSYRLDELGWLQFERVCSLLLAADAGLSELRWIGHADTGRVALVPGPIGLAAQEVRLDGPVTVAVVWVAEDESPERRRVSLVGRVVALGSWCEEQVIVLTNLDGGAARTALERQSWSEHRTTVVLGDRELGEILDLHAGARAAMPSVLGLRDLLGTFRSAFRRDPLFARGMTELPVGAEDLHSPANAQAGHHRRRAAAAASSSREEITMAPPL